jgi:hypothetical protein
MRVFPEIHFQCEATAVGFRLDLQAMISAAVGRVMGG